MNVEVLDFSDQVIEQRIIETLIRDGVEAYEEISDFVTESDFYYSGYRECFKILKKHFDNDERYLDRGLLQSELQNTSLDFDLFRISEIEKWHDLDIQTANIHDFGIALKETSRKRDLLNTWRKYGEFLNDNRQRSSEFLKDGLLKICMDIEDTKESNQYRHEFNQSIKDTCRKLITGEYGKAIPTGFKFLDEKLKGGFFTNNLIVISASTNVGKSIFSNQILLNMMQGMGEEMGEDEKPIILFTLEMDHNEIAHRALTFFSNNTKDEIKILLENPSCERFQELKEKTRLACAPSKNGIPRMIIYDKSDLTLNELKSLVFDEVRRYGGVKCVCLDYLQFMSVNPRGNTSLEYGQIAKDLKVMAQTYHIPVIAVCQNNRSSDASEIPTNNDIGESVVISRTANVIIQLKNSKTLGNKRIFVTKNRDNPPFGFECKFWGQFSRFDTEYASEISLLKEDNQNDTENTTRKAGQGFSYGCGNSTYNNYNKTH